MSVHSYLSDNQSKKLTNFMYLYLDHVNSETPEIYKRGVAILKKDKKIILTEEKDEFWPFNFLVNSQSSDKKYSVNLFVEDKIFEFDCECEYFNSHGFACKHTVAVAMAINEDKIEEISSKTIITEKVITFPQIQMNHIFKNINKLSYWEINNKFNNSRNRYDHKLNSQIESVTETARGYKYVFAVSKTKKVVSTLEIINKNDLNVTCECGDTNQNAICKHVYVAMEHARNKQGTFPWFMFCNFEEEKNNILSKYGLSIQDSEAKDFIFKLDHYGNLVLDSKPSEFVELQSEKDLELLNRKILKKELLTKSARPKSMFVSEETKLFSVGIYFAISNQEVFPIKVDACKVSINKSGKESITKLGIYTEDNYPLLSGLTDEKFEALTSFGFPKYNEQLKQRGFKPYDNYAQASNDYYRNKDVERALRTIFIENLEKYWQTLAQFEYIFVLPEKMNFSKAALQPVKLNLEKLRFSFDISENERFISLTLVFLNANGSHVSLGEKAHLEGVLLNVNNELHITENFQQLVQVLEVMPNGKLLFPIHLKQAVIRKTIIPLFRHFGFELPKEYEIKKVEEEIKFAVYFKEIQGENLMMTPKFIYGDHTVEYDHQEEIFAHDSENKPYSIIRNNNEETKFFESLRGLHPLFSRQFNQNFFYLPFKEVMKDLWFINVSKILQEAGVILVGVDELKQFKYNTNEPRWEMKASSGIDWFDLEVEISWGDQVLGLRDIKNALKSGQNFVLLGDGTIGMLPQEWLKKYGLLLNFGDIDQNIIKISKLHFNILDDLADQLNNEDIANEIEEKKKKLINIESVDLEAVPSDIIATLRPYQEAGFNWLQILDNIGWGGCLADDMGLGKTLQTITYLQYLKQKYPKSSHLIVCPTSLIFNWENELKKFAPKLRYHIYYGANREFSDTHFDEHDIILTSYGVARIDFETLKSFTWNYIILDESQTIKNPDAAISKAVSLLPAQNRLILSGTPLQNNTMDIFSQFNFLNRGLLGNKDFFKREFANPIDKHGDKEKSAQLKKLIHPFILRRTKEQVATDLPDKTEIVLWCQMEREQKSMYDEYKNYYRQTILQKIEEEGIAKSGIYILEGLLRLRQICDDPRLVKDDEIGPIEGVKIQELTREVTENIGTHKILIFSQFTEMLSLIRQEFEKQDISYCYIDGSVGATKRQEEVNRFQNDTSVKVFLISLKAGGVGLNLTAADYVYLVDPWWNPAAEQQAIDRAHRIGQKNKIFAYKMVCKDTVEEKILKLQEKKMALAKDLIQEESSILKSMTKEDVAFLFS